MHTVWKGAISFGLVHVPVKMFSATEDKDISMKYIHKVCGSPISYVRRCPACDVDVNWEEISRGYEYEKGKFVLFEKEELEQLNDHVEKRSPFSISSIWKRSIRFIFKNVLPLARSGGLERLPAAARSDEAVGENRHRQNRHPLQKQPGGDSGTGGLPGGGDDFYPDEIRPIPKSPTSRKRFKSTTKS
ncbi:hypothetical protein HMSSN036_89040 [Paenibacillus macerans]|nr:hypothetical protein HMSSN036_89040 [Paenibacillus macerans]